jgi:vancomycin resistance protein VanJ
MAFKRRGSPPDRSRISRAFEWGWIASTVVYGIVLALLSECNAAGPERWWWSNLNLYLPQWIWGIPGLLLFIAALLLRSARRFSSARLRKRWMLLPVFGLLWVAGPLMGFCWRSPPNASVSETDGPRLTLMTYNVKWGKRSLGAISGDITLARPDLLVLQDSGDEMNALVKTLLPRDHFFASGQYFIASRWPLSHTETRTISAPGILSDSFHYLRCQFEVGSRTVTLYDVHLLTPREGLTALWNLTGSGLSDLVENGRTRFHQAMSLAMELSDEPGPLLVAGDLNAPVQGLACRALLDCGLQDAFSAAGRGYGYTYGRFTPLRHAFLRIDHVLASRHWRIERCRIGNQDGSDHRPVVAELALTSP